MMSGKYNCITLYLSILILNYRFNTIEEMCNSVGTVTFMPRKCVRQTHCSNVPAETSSAYYRRSIFIPLLDHLLSEMDMRFTTHHQTGLRGMCLVPSALITIGFEDTKPKVADLVEMYKEDLPPQGSIQLQHAYTYNTNIGLAPCYYYVSKHQHATPYFVYSTSYFLLIRVFIQWFKEDPNSIEVKHG